MVFPKIKRSVSTGDIQRCCRFKSLSGRRWKYGPSRGQDCILFLVDRDIKLLGVCLFGSENSTYSVELMVRDLKRFKVLVLKTGTFSSELLQGNKFTYFGVKVLFDNEQVLLEKKTLYEIEAKITGPDSTCGDNGDQFVTCSGVTFKFSNTYSSNGTNIQKGQFPELMFSL